VRARRIIDSTSTWRSRRGRTRPPVGLLVWYAATLPTQLLWASDPNARHSRNITSRPEIGLVVFDSSVPIGGAEGAYMEAAAEQLTGVELERAIEIYSRRSQEVGAPAWTLADVTVPHGFASIARPPPPSTSSTAASGGSP
jgi:hypothetical protein